LFLSIGKNLDQKAAFEEKTVDTTSNIGTVRGPGPTCLTPAAQQINFPGLEFR